MKRAILSCSGMDKQMGSLARELAIRLNEKTGDEIVCPTLLASIPARYEELLKAASLIVIDGCNTRCASKLANRCNAKVERKILVSEAARDLGIDPESGLTPGPNGLKLVAQLLQDVERDLGEEASSGSSVMELAPPEDFLIVTHDKYQFKIPKEGFLFNENDSWARAFGAKARVGVSDYVQQKLTDITYFEPPALNADVEQFGELGTIESTKSLLEIVSPVTGKVTAINLELTDNPGLINEDPYGAGWIAEVELTDLESDKELLLDGEAYAEIVKRKAAEDAG
jgi:glycine cleavage system H protein